MTDVADRRRHAAQLDRLHRFFDPAQILVLQYERCRADPVAEYRRTLAFLGVRDTAFHPRRLKPAAGGPQERGAAAARACPSGCAARRSSG